MKNIRKLALSLATFVVASISLTGCKKNDTLLFLNWGEYISDELVEAFEEKYDCNLIVDIAESNELFYSKLKSGTTKYDLCCPTDYMIEKMYIKGLIQEIDLSLLTNYKEGIFMDEVNQVRDNMNESMYLLMDNYRGDINNYNIPYFWGTFGLMYNKNNSYFIDDDKNFKPDIFEKYDNLDSVWDVYFRDEKVEANDRIPNSLKVGMYNTVRFSYAACMIYDSKNPNAILNSETQNKFRDILDKQTYTDWGTDTLKHKIASDNLDLAFNYTGDCLDMAYVEIQNGKNFEDLSFYTYTPKDTIAHIDSLVIPSGASHLDLAHKFIDFMLDPANVWLNSRNVGYCPPLQETYDMIVEERVPDKETYPYTYVEQNDEEIHWLNNWSKAISITYPIDENKKKMNNGIPLTFFENEDLKILSNIVNNIKAVK